MPEQPIVSLTSDISLGFAIAGVEDKGLIMEAVVSLLKNKFWEHREDLVVKLPKWRYEHLCLEELKNGIWNRSGYLYNCRQTYPQVFLWETLQKTISCCCGISSVSWSNYEVKLRTLKTKRVWKEAARFILQRGNGDKIVLSRLLAALRPQNHTRTCLK